MKPVKKLNIRSTAKPFEKLTFNEWINYIHAEAEKRYLRNLNNYLNNKISKQ
jgi:hypothetical protein